MGVVFGPMKSPTSLLHIRFANIFMIHVTCYLLNKCLVAQKCTCSLTNVTCRSLVLHVFERLALILRFNFDSKSIATVICIISIVKILVLDNMP